MFLISKSVFLASLEILDFQATFRPYFNMVKRCWIGTQATPLEGTCEFHSKYSSGLLCQFLNIDIEYKLNSSFLFFTILRVGKHFSITQYFKIRKTKFKSFMFEGKWVESIVLCFKFLFQCFNMNTRVLQSLCSYDPSWVEVATSVTLALHRCWPVFLQCGSADPLWGHCVPCRGARALMELSAH